ncbi:MAG: hypothetical protein HZA89_13435 [Verrucomicrobia bacterium]|nr:hypothetical protein [Verrucomicrobiota bacterium]
MKLSGTPNSHSAKITFSALAGVALLAALFAFPASEAGAAAKTGGTPAARQVLSAVGKFQAGLDARQIKNGRNIFVGYCGECHVLYDPTWYPADDWERLLGNMSGRAKLNRTQAEDLRNFIRTVRGAE